VRFLFLFSSLFLSLSLSLSVSPPTSAHVRKINVSSNPYTTTERGANGKKYKYSPADQVNVRRRRLRRKDCHRQTRSFLHLTDRHRARFAEINEHRASSDKLTRVHTSQYRDNLYSLTYEPVHPTTPCDCPGKCYFSCL
jgi:hypothetical protein